MNVTMQGEHRTEQAEACNLKLQPVAVPFRQDALLPVSSFIYSSRLFILLVYLFICLFIHLVYLFITHHLS
jgi:hypothetical protein